MLEHCWRCQQDISAGDDINKTSLVTCTCSDDTIPNATPERCHLETGSVFEEHNWRAINRKGMPPAGVAWDKMTKNPNPWVSLVLCFASSRIQRTSTSGSQRWSAKLSKKSVVSSSSDSINVAVSAGAAGRTALICGAGANPFTTLVVANRQLWQSGMSIMNVSLLYLLYMIMGP